MPEIRPEIMRALLEFQRNEITEYNVYLTLAQRADEENRKVLERIARDELRHYSTLRKYTGREVDPDAKRILYYSIIARIFGFTFAIKLMERGEEIAQRNYDSIKEEVPEASVLLREEDEHEERLIRILKEERVEYVGSMILGLNDAIVELTGALSGLSFTIANTLFVGVAGLIMGIAAAMSMAASEYLSRKSEGVGNPRKGALYTGLAYISSVALMTLPYFLLSDKLMALASMFTIVALIVVLFSFYVSVVKDRKFVGTAMEMLLIIAGVSTASMAIGWLARILLGIEV